MAEITTSIVQFDAKRAADATPIHLVHSGSRTAINEQLPTEAAKTATLMNFNGELGAVVATPDGVLVGVGDGRDPFAVGAAASRLGAGDYRLASSKLKSAVPLVVLGWALGAYRFDKYKNAMATPTLIAPEGLELAPVHQQAKAVALVRDLVNTPTEDMGPAQLAAAAKSLGASFDARIEITEGEALRKGFPLVHAVGRAAATPPLLVDLRWGPEDGVPVTLVGKGVCFDSGGLNIKGSTGMALMKKDMGGAANALGLASMIMAADLPIKLRVLIPAVENAIGGNAFRPGDVFTSRSGQTVEISNTDAEGRLILADALAYAAEEKPARIISLATLTGAARVALGPDIVPLYSTDDDFANAVVESGTRVNDPVWRMPLWARYDDYLSSQIADVNHASTGGFAGSITAALFLRRFVDKSIPYTHLDIYAWTPEQRPGRPKGGEATGIRALYDTLAKI
ncbi:leucyl aminopeptidase family protein [Parvularcula sp. LCG005]|uniref:leucyl aminopeptidase family protein n=1 Tax=Parvularcula sp. LCG005 TaxID=3078805 RepID=UPI0029422910|nr:leucyl aminopeptidase family protein [Parvularcula sp. LCG005]WOI53570.1 leucyl aminopeptidase family protein [Parvularcula sp. LCG005]